ncbi:MAG: 3-oxoacyl-[acyl-carrier-protein] reductase [Coriobacteriia bacterium]|nr:3-oxoacyl-[acyl-carrier-protein] reductase [Coriobacteriia bacterium]
MSSKTTSPEPSSQLALVTGGSRGIGRAICIKLAACGYNVALTYARNEAEAQETAQLCREAAQSAGFSTTRFATYGGDIASTTVCEELFAACVAELGAPDILVNNAGITRDNLIMRMSLEDFDEVLSVNLKAAFIFCKLAARSMAKKRFGRIINISSVVGLAGNAGQANYAASKAGLIGLTKTLAKELGSRFVTVNAIAPGFIETSMTEALGTEARTSLTNSLAIPRLGTPDDIASLVGFLASDEAAYITSQVIAVDGGMTL